MVVIGKECGFTSNFDMLRSFTPRKKGVTAENDEQPIKANQIAERPLVSQSRDRATNSLWRGD